MVTYLFILDFLGGNINVHYAVFSFLTFTWGGTESISAKEMDYVLLQCLLPCSEVLKDSPWKCGPSPLSDTLDPLRYHVVGLLFCGGTCVDLLFGRGAATLRSP